MRHLAIYTALSLGFVGALPAEAQTRTLRRNGEVLSGAASKRYLSCFDHWLRRTHPCRPGRKQFDVPAFHGLRDRCRALFQLMLAVVAASPHISQVSRCGGWVRAG